MQRAPTEFTVTESHLSQRRNVARLTVISVTALCAVLGVVSLVAAVSALRSSALLPGAVFLGLGAAALFLVFSSQNLYGRLVGRLEERRVTLERKKLVDMDAQRTRSVALRDIKRLEVVRNRQGELLAFNVQTETRTLSFAGLGNMDTLLEALSSLQHVSVTEKTKWLPFKHTEFQFAFYIGLGALLLALSELIAPTTTPSLFSVLVTSWLVALSVLELLQSRDADTRYLREKRRSGVTFIILGALLLGLELV